MKKSVLDLVRGLSRWCLEMSDSGPQSARRDFLKIMDQSNRFILGFEESLDDLASYEGVTQDEACRIMRRILFYGHDVYHYGQPNRKLLLELCLELGLKAPPGWHGHFIFKKKEYRRMHHPRDKMPARIREIWKRNRKPPTQKP